MSIQSPVCLLQYLGLRFGVGPSTLSEVLVTMERCILVVEDSRDLRRVVVQALREASYAVLEAEDGLMALHILEHGGVDIDLVLTDIKMPRMGGVELGRRIAQGHWRVPVLYMSGDPGFEPIAPLLPKPFSMRTLVRVVNGLLLPTPQTLAG